MWSGVATVTMTLAPVNDAPVAGTAAFTSIAEDVALADNAGTAVSTNIDLAAVSGNPIAGNGGRGDGVGFHGNGNDAYASVAIGKDEAGKNHVWLTVLNANGTLRWSKTVADDMELLAPGRCDVGMDSLGRVAVVFDDTAGAVGSMPFGVTTLIERYRTVRLFLGGGRS